MIREDKQALVDELSEKFQSHNAFYIADASGMSVAKINEFRRLCFNRGLEFKVYKNSFIRKALDTLGGDTSEMDAALKGQSGVLFSKESGNAPAKLLKDFYKSQGDWASGGGLHNKDNWFKLTFQNYAGITYCEDASNKCVNGIFTYRNKCMH